MTARWCLAVAVLAFGATGEQAAAQDYLVPVDGSRAVGASYGVLPVGADVISTSPLFLEGPSGRGVRASVTGTVAGAPLHQADPSGGGRVTIGFDYLRPFWSFRDFTLAVPPAYAAAFPGLAGIGHTDNHFAFVPQLQYNYHVTDLDFDVRAAGTFLSLAGRFQRDVATTGVAAGNLNVTYDLTLISVIPVQVARRYDAEELFGPTDGETAAVVDLSIGTRYAALDQDYTSTLNSNGVGGVNVATRTTSQTFRGLGITAAMAWEVPVSEDVACFLGARGSVLVGENQRSSTATVVAAGSPAFADSLSESRTTLVPVVEAEAGIAWGTELGSRLARAEVPPEFTVRLGVSGQYWGGLGPLSAGSHQGFRTSDLFLAGVSIQVGLRH